MNNYDFNFNGGIFDTQYELKSKFSLKMNNLKWFCYLLIFFNILQIIFFMGYSFFSIIIVFYIFYVSYTILFRIMRDEDLNFEFDHLILSKQLQSLRMNILIIVFLCIIDFGFGIVFMNDYFSVLFQSQDKFEYYFAIFSTYMTILRFGYLCFISFYLKILSLRE